MSIRIEIEEKPNKSYDRKVNNPREVFNLEEVQAIKNAIQEHVLFIGLDNGNNIRKIKLIGIGNSKNVIIDNKNIIRLALLTASDKVILVHNHPSNTLKPSEEDKYITKVISKLLKVFNIELVDHIIVIEDNFVSMGAIENMKIDSRKNQNRIKKIDNIILTDENNNLKEKIKILESKLQKYEKIQKEEENEFE